jgi:hypothetical protein
MAFPNFISRWIHRCEKQVGLITLFVGLTAFALTALIWNPYRATFAAIGAFAIIGSAERFHINRKSELLQRCHSSYEADLMLAVAKKHPLWKPKLFKEFLHGQARFNVGGFEQAPIPFMISEPLCPRCSNKLIERITVFFPGIIRIKWLCNCGFKTKSNKTLAEIQNEAAKIGNLPDPNR